MSDYQTIIPGGPYIVKTNEYGGIEREIGWATLKIKDDHIITVVCHDDIIGNNNICILRMQMKNLIPRNYKTYYENIKIMFQRGYNTCYAYNFSNLNKFKLACEFYFEELDKKICRENELNK